jgi:demethylmenaquinone methyltransferase/2-methoxy-6-polyprenyl-1,4-benzoquinol methylase
MRLEKSDLRPLAKDQVAGPLFAGIARHYDAWAEVFSFLQYHHWEDALVEQLRPWPGQRVLDVSTGTGAAAQRLARRGCQVTGLDPSRAMLLEGATRIESADLSGSIRLVQGRAESLPFADRAFVAVTFTFLLRYVIDPMQPIAEMIRVLRPGGRLVMLEFAIPESPLIYPLWLFYVSSLLPLASRVVSPGWAEVGGFLGNSITGFHQDYPYQRLVKDWRQAGLADVSIRHLPLGGAFIASAIRPEVPDP